MKTPSLPRLFWRILFSSLVLLSGNIANAQVAQPSPAPTPVTQPSSDFVTFHNDFYWLDQNGQRILTRSGCLRQFNGVFYWYGGNYPRFLEQYCYKSTDLVHWTNLGVCMRQDVDANRIDVLYNAKTKKYVMFMKYNGNGAFLGIATADKPEGPFTLQSQTLVDNARMGDMSAYQDDDGTAYIAYVSWAVGTNAQHGIYKMSDDYLTLDKRVYLWDIRSREAPHIFKRNGIYYYGTSQTAGIRSSGTSYYTATNLAGPWSPAQPLTTPGSTNSWDSQVDFVYPFPGSQGTVYMFDGDRWTKDLPKGRNGDYVWLPTEFEGDTPIVNYIQDWELNVKTGAWRKIDASRNLAAGKTATASSDNGVNLAKNVTAPKTYQDYINIHWDSGQGDQQWIMVDLGAPMEVNRVILKWNTNAAKSFKIQTSTDAATWADVFSTTLGASYSVTDEKFKTTTARYVRMNATERAPLPPGGRGGRGARGGRGGAPAAASSTATASVAPASATSSAPAVSAASATTVSAGSGSTVSTTSAPAAAATPTVSGTYSLFDFMVLKD
ncbi:MAG TPA: family 43 glycosylhydrolase [Opitutales bacterium]|jgi:hypothetical protein|nr:family 43 glycosylhydrolase [Opitutales bacterium]